MSDPPKSAPTFSFTNTSTSGSSSLFGTAPVNNTSTGGLFGSGAVKPASQSSNIFGSLSTGSATPSSGLFGAVSTTSTPSLFGNTPTTSAPSQSSVFGAGASTGPSGSIFNAAPSGSGNIFGGGNAGNSGSSGFSTPNKNLNAGTTQTANLFGGASTGTSNIFSGLGNTPATSDQTGNTTPATTKTISGSLFANLSTTPAGPPPTGPAANSNSDAAFPFGKPQGQVANPFGGSALQSSSQAPSSAAPSNPFGSLTQSSGGLFGLNKPSGSATNTPSTQASSSLFAATTTTTSTGLFGNTQPVVSSGTSLFGGLNASKGAADQTSQADATKPAPLFPALSGQKALDAPTSQPVTSNIFAGAKIGSASTATNPNFGFPPTQSSAETTTGQNATSGTSLFTNLGGPVASPTAAASSSTPFPSFDTSKGKAPVTTSDTSATSASGTTSTSAQPAPSFLSNQSSQPAASSQPAGQSAAATTKASTTGDETSKSNNLGASTTGPRPVAQSRLKNKSMDEIITRWASDLSKYQKEFQKQAMKVAEWDRMLVENSDKIQKLYGSTLEAERATSEVERQLTHVENDQAELESWLDHYETLVDEMLSTQVGQGDTLQGPDQERERTYKLAEKLSDRLNEMAKDLTSMIENINGASSNLSKNSKPDDPLSQIVRVLNGHLSQLQQIDQGASALQAKVLAVQKASRNVAPMNGAHGYGSDAADDFYRSYMGRR